MVNTSQYPHILQIKDVSGSWVDHAICRDQPNDKGRSLPVGDGTFFVFSSIVFIPLGVERLLPGQDVQVIEAGGTVRVKTDVKRFSVGSLHCRLWV